MADDDWNDEYTAPVSQSSQYASGGWEETDFGGSVAASARRAPRGGTGDDDRPARRAPREPREGDWNCPADSCGQSNFASRSVCFKCNEPKPEGLGGGTGDGDRPARRAPREPREGDWNCPADSCGQSNFASRSVCFKCNEPKPEGLGGGTGDDDRPARRAPREPREGDWNCPADSCGQSNFASRSVCFKCNEPKPEGLGGATGGDDSQPKRENYVPPELLEGQALFEERNELYGGTGQHFNDYDSIPVIMKDQTGEIELEKFNSFSKIGLRQFLLENLEKCKYHKPTPIQRSAIPILLNHRDVMACAQTGSGKTAAFVLPILNTLLSRQSELGTSGAVPAKPEALILAPTRELALQIGKEATAYGSGSVVKIRVVYGGVSVMANKNSIRNGCNVLIATPGRLKQLITESYISLENIEFFVLDEADRMLDMGFMDDVKEVVEHMPARGERISGMFSATFPDAIQVLAQKFLENYVFISVGIVGGACKDVKQEFEEVESRQKRKRVMDIIKDFPSDKIVIFCGTKKGADILAMHLSESGVSSTSIHGDRLQSQREEALREFTAGKRRVLVATAVAARGLDIPKVSMVVNYDMPSEIEEYVHRIGRTGRVGHEGRAVSFFDVTKDAALVQPLVLILQGAGQKVPDWLIAHASGCGGSGGSADTFGAHDSRGVANGVTAGGNDEVWDD